MIRGHIRNSFNDNKLYNLIKNIYEISPNIKIYIHTWSIVANNLSWREITSNNTVVKKKMIYEYFSDLKHLIKDILIDDDSKINLIGNTSGNLNENSNMPIVSWKNYWYGKYELIKHINDKCSDKNELIVNLRFDILENSNSLDQETIIEFIKKNIGLKITKNKFLYDIDTIRSGVDNIYIGNIFTMGTLIEQFHYYLDVFLSKIEVVEGCVLIHELLVYNINNILFD
jgi:hypothetical protein